MVETPLGEASISHIDNNCALSCRKWAAVHKSTINECIRHQKSKLDHSCVFVESEEIQSLEFVLAENRKTITAGLRNCMFMMQLSCAAV